MLAPLSPNASTPEEDLGVITLKKEFHKAIWNRTNVHVGTQDVDGYIYVRPNGQRVYLLDTPGFDDTEKDNIRVLRRIAMILYTIYASDRFDLAGVLYLHRISDVRMAGSSLKTMRLIEKLCGESNFGAISVATTMWELVDPELAGNRERSLISTPDFFGTLAAGYATIMRHFNTADSAAAIVEHMLRKQRTVILGIQREMVIERKSLKNTAAGQYLLGDFEQMRARYEREMEQLQEALEDATQEKDEDLITMISEQRRDYQEKIKTAELAEGELSVTPEQMEQQQQEWFAQRAKEEMEGPSLESSEKTPREIELEQQLERSEREHIREMNKLRLANKGKDVENDQLKKQHRMLKDRVKEQLYREREERERKDPRIGLVDQGFRILLQQGLGFIQPMRRALTFPREEKIAIPQIPKASESKGRSGSQQRKFRKKQRDKQILEFDKYDELDDELYSETSTDESPAVHAAQHAHASMAPTASVVSSHRQQVQPGFENPSYVVYDVDTSSYTSRTTSVALARAYPSSEQQQ